MSVKCFVDTNVFVYTQDSSEPVKQSQAQKWLNYLWHHETGRTSVQVLNEYYVTVSQKLNPGLSKAQARISVRALSVWQPLEISVALVEAAWDLQDQYSYSWWDSLVITSALFLDCAWLLSEDMQHKQEIGRLTIINPFLADLDTVFGKRR